MVEGREEMRLIKWTRKWVAVMHDVDSVSIETHTCNLN